MYFFQVTSADLTVTSHDLLTGQGDMYGAGTETSVHTVLFCLQFLASPELQQLQAAIQRQIEAECGAGEPGLHHALPLLRATLLGRCHQHFGGCDIITLSEVQRLRPVTPQGVPHGVVAPVKVGGQHNVWRLPLPGTL